MTTWEKYGRDRHKPSGEWVQTALVEKVVGIEYRKADAFAFAIAAKKAEQQGCIYGVRLELEPNNPVDKNAVMVWGFAENKGWLGGVKETEWHIGYLSAELAAELHRDVLSAGAPVAAELYNIFENGDYLDFSIIVLAPRGFSVSSRDKVERMRSGSPETPQEKASRLVAEQNYDGAINFLLDCCDQQEAESMAKDHGVAPWCYEALAKIFRKLKLRDEEIAILERFDNQTKSPGVLPTKLRSRLEALR